MRFAIVLSLFLAASLRAEDSIAVNAVDGWDVASLKAGEWVLYETRKPGKDGEVVRFEKLSCVADGTTVRIEKAEMATREAKPDRVLVLSVDRETRQIQKAWAVRKGAETTEVKLTPPPKDDRAAIQFGDCTKSESALETLEIGGQALSCDRIELAGKLKAMTVPDEFAVSLWVTEALPFKTFPDRLELGSWCLGFRDWAKRPKNPVTIVKATLKVGKHEEKLTLVAWGKDAKATVEVK
ncbi:MAG: hypothetical protein K8T20_12065 [Planctomycetes bacterium]|nr:hypothetical protein [Planctomycetota bacterium]